MKGRVTAMLSHIRGTPPPPPQSQMIVFRVTTAETHEFCCVSSSPYGQPVHWFGRRTSECTGEHSKCKGCVDNWPQKWQGYLHVLYDCGKREAFLEITSTCFHLLVAKMADKQAWRGMRFRISRTKGGPRGRYLVDVLESRANPEELPVEKDPLPLLRKLWRAKKGPGHVS